MVDQNRLNQLARVARLYYEDNLNQIEIATMLGTSHSTISRMLNEAMENKIVEVVIRYPISTIPALGKCLRNKYGLKEAFVFPSSGLGYEEQVQNLGQLAAYVLEKHLEENMTLGISLGRAVAATTHAFKPTGFLHCRVVRLQGAMENELMEGTNLAQVLSSQLGGEFVIVPAPMIMRSSEACRLIMKEPSVIETLRIAENADIALVGMGSMDPAISTTLRNNLITLNELIELKKAGAVGEVFGKYFDKEGRTLNVDFNRRSVSIPLEKLRDFKTVIGVAAGLHKVEAILGLIHGHLINILVTDSDAAHQLLDDSCLPASREYPLP
jgi:DNA-binding transcriptional regulator LsrR (DeoR family)